MPKHIGIVACSYEGAALCYRTICNEGSDFLGEHNHPEVSLHTHPLSEYMRFIETGDWEGVADIMLSSSEKLFKAGADFLISPDNTIHQAYSSVISRSPLPWLHIGEEVAKVAEINKFRKTGILGTRFLMEGPVYPEVLKARGINYSVPSAEQRIRINDIIFNELVYGVIEEGSKKFFLDIVDELKKGGCDSVILGCTEIPLIVLPGESSLPVLDSTRLLARAALNYSIS
ncbi:MAG: aspartate racemase [Bacteroidetes bacterium GWA2_40_15]|nr:MAG: aspartate racemase [Bacteroidetes bacterium GWA2_40_15]HBH84660.1 aspartate racemase [Bacteroidales bacterium]